MLSVDIAGRIGTFDLKAAFQAPTGVTALVGPSGAGKSLILRAIAGLWKPSEGGITLGDKVFLDAGAGVNLPPQQRGVGAVFQQALLFPHMSVERNLRYGYREESNEFSSIVNLLELSGLLDRMPRNLSGGEAQRVSIGRALLSQPDILLLDEPMTGLDAQRRDAILPFLQTLCEKLTVPIVYVTHRNDEVAQLAQTVVRIEAGRTHASMSPAEYMALVETSGIDKS